MTPRSRSEVYVRGCLTLIALALLGWLMILGALTLIGWLLP